MDPYNSPPDSSRHSSNKEVHGGEEGSSAVDGTTPQRQRQRQQQQQQQRQRHEERERATEEAEANEEVEVEVGVGMGMGEGGKEAVLQKQRNLPIGVTGSNKNTEQEKQEAEREEQEEQGARQPQQKRFGRRAEEGSKRRAGAHRAGGQKETAREEKEKEEQKKKNGRKEPPKKKGGLFSFLGKVVQGNSGKQSRNGKGKSSAQPSAPARGATAVSGAAAAAAAGGGGAEALKQALARVAQLEAELRGAHRKRLEDFYDVFNPQKKHDAPSLLQKYSQRGELDAMFKRLRERYMTPAVLAQIRGEVGQGEASQAATHGAEVSKELQLCKATLKEKAERCETLELQAKSDQALRQALRQATHDMSQAVSAAEADAESKVRAAKEEAEKLVQAAEVAAAKRVAAMEAGTAEMKASVVAARQDLEAKAAKAQAVTDTHEAVESSLRAKVAVAEAAVEAEQQARVQEIESVKQDHDQALSKHKAQVAKYKEQKSVLVDATKRMQTELEESAREIEQLKQEMAELASSTQAKVAAAESSRKSQVSKLANDVQLLLDDRHNRSQSVLANLYSFVMAASSKHSGFLFKRGSGYEGQMHTSAKKKQGGLIVGIKNRFFSSSQEKRRFFSIDAKFIQYFSSDKDSEGGIAPLGSVPISDIQSLGILDTADKSSSSSSSVLLQSMDTTNYCFEIELSDRTYSLRAGDRLIRALWIYRLRLLLAIRVQIAAHTQMLTEAASFGYEKACAETEYEPIAAESTKDGATQYSEPVQESSMGAPGNEKWQENLDTLSSKLLQIYAVTFGFTVNTVRHREITTPSNASATAGTSGNAQADNGNTDVIQRTPSPMHVVAKMFNEVPSQGCIVLDGGGTRIEVIPTFSSSQCLWWKYSSDEVEGMADEQNRIGFQVLFHPLRGGKSLTTESLFSETSAEFGHILDFKHVYADITMMIRYSMMEKQQQNQPQNAHPKESPINDTPSKVQGRRKWPGRKVCMPMVMVPAFRTQQMGMLTSPGVGHISLIWNNVHSPNTDKKLRYWLQVTKDIRSPPEWLDT